MKKCEKCEGKLELIKGDGSAYTSFYICGKCDSTYAISEIEDEEMNKKEKKIPKEPKEEKRHNPTPYLGVPKSNKQVFTVAENKLLDQITLEICEAWAKDLEIIKRGHREVLDTIKDLRDVRHTLDQINDLGFIPILKEVIDKQNQTFQFMEEIRQRTFQTHEQVLGMRELLSKALDKIPINKPINKPIEKNKWWEFWK